MNNMKETNDRSCERADELMKILYDEASDAEATSFQQHILSCSSCREEFTNLRGVRNSLIAWRQESLPTFSIAPFSVRETVAPTPRAALRAFFSLSPLWMKGAVACVSVVFCILAVLTVFNLRKARPIANQDQLLTASQLEDLVNKRAEQKFEEMKARDEKKAVVAIADNTVPRQVVQSSPKRTTHSQQQRPLTRAEREQLAADLRLSSPTEETELDLLSDRLNRQDD
jgi:hypothetical protein